MSVNLFPFVPAIRRTDLYIPTFTQLKITLTSAPPFRVNSSWTICYCSASRELCWKTVDRCEANTK